MTISLASLLVDKNCNRDENCCLCKGDLLRIADLACHWNILGFSLRIFFQDALCRSHVEAPFEHKPRQSVS